MFENAEQERIFRNMLCDYLCETGHRKAVEQMQEWTITNEYVDGPMLVALHDEVTDAS